MNTLKTHLKSIYRKLDASSRSDAVARGRASRASLIPPKGPLAEQSPPLG